MKCVSFVQSIIVVTDVIPSYSYFFVNFINVPVYRITSRGSATGRLIGDACAGINIREKRGDYRSRCCDYIKGGESPIALTEADISIVIYIKIIEC